MLSWIAEKYDGHIETFAPAAQTDDFFALPDVLRRILSQSDGVMETMRHPVTGETERVGWIVYPLSEMVRWTGFYREEYGIDGVVFSDDGAGNPYYLKPDGKIYLWDSGGETAAADSMREFFE